MDTLDGLEHQIQSNSNKIGLHANVLLLSLEKLCWIWKREGKRRQKDIINRVDLIHCGIIEILQKYNDFINFYKMFFF